MKIIAVTNRKGGVGKTTLATHIAAGLASKGYSVGLVDTDSQGNAGMMVGIPPEDGLFNLLISKQPLDQIAKYVPRENYAMDATETSGHLWLISSHERTYQIPYMLQQDETFLFLQKMEEFTQRANLDYIIIDTNPSMSMFDGAVYLATDAFLYVTECEMLSIQGVQKAIQQMQTFSKQRKQYLHRDSKILGIIPNKYRAKTIIHQKNVADLKTAFGDMVWDPIILRTIWTEASNFYQPVFLLEERSHAASQAWDVVNRAEEALKQWDQIDEKS